MHRHRVGDEVIFPIDLEVELLLEESADAGSRLKTDVVIARGEEGGTPESPLLIEDVANSSIPYRGNLDAAFRLNTQLAQAQKANDASLDHVSGVAVGRPAELGEQRRSGEAALGLDILLHAPRYYAPAGRRVASRVQ